MTRFRGSSPSLSDNSSVTFDDLEDFELFPDLNFTGNNGLSKQVSVASNNGDYQDSTTKSRSNGTVVAVKLDAQKERELVDYLIGKSTPVEPTDSDCFFGPLKRDTESKNSDVIEDRGVVNAGQFAYQYSERELYGKCMSKNAIAARENRLKKKQYVKDLEDTVKSISAENGTLKKQVSTMEEAVTDLKTEVKYLKKVLANQSTLSALLKNIPSVSGINLKSTSLAQVEPTTGGRKRRRTDRKDESETDDNNVNNNKDEGEAVLEVNTDSVNGYENSNAEGAKLPKLDHCYATNNPAATQYQKRQQMMTMRSRRESDADTTDTGAGVCLHVSGENVSLEFCAQCSRRAAAGQLSS